MSDFYLQRLNRGEVQVLSRSGCLSNDECCHMEKELAHLLEQKHCRVILDLALLSSATSMSLARLPVGACEINRYGGEWKLAGMSVSLTHSAERAGFDRRKDFAADVAAATRAMSQASEVVAAGLLVSK